MPRYFFHIIHPDGLSVPDEEGAMFEDLETAKAEAVASIRDIAAEIIKGGGGISGFGIEVRSDVGVLLYTVSAGEVLD